MGFHEKNAVMRMTLILKLSPIGLVVLTRNRKNLNKQIPKDAATNDIVFSIIEIAKDNGLIAFNYLTYLFEKLPNIVLENYVWKLFYIIVKSDKNICVFQLTLTYKTLVFKEVLSDSKDFFDCFLEIG